MSASPPPVYDPSWRPEYKETQKAKDLCLRLDSVSSNSSPALSSPVEEPRSSADNHPLGRALTTNRSLPSDLNITVHENIRPTTTGPEPTEPPQAARIIFDGTHQVEILEGYKQDYILTRKGKQSFFRLKVHIELFPFNILPKCAFSNSKMLIEIHKYIGLAYL